MPIGLYGERFEVTPTTTVGGSLAAGLQPTIALNANAGTTTTASFSANSTDRCGTITTTNGGSGQAVGTFAVVTFAKAFASAPVVLVSGFDNTNKGVFVVSATATNTFTIVCTGTPGSNDTIEYVVFGAGA